MTAASDADPTTRVRVVTPAAAARLVLVVRLVVAVTRVLVVRLVVAVTQVLVVRRAAAVTQVLAVTRVAAVTQVLAADWSKIRTATGYLTAVIIARRLPIQIKRMAIVTPWETPVTPTPIRRILL